MRAGASGKVASGSKKIRNFSIHQRAPKFTAAGQLEVPRPLTQAQRAEQRNATEQAIAGKHSNTMANEKYIILNASKARNLEHSHLPSFDVTSSLHTLGADDFGAPPHGHDSDSDSGVLGVLDGSSQLDVRHAGGELRRMLDQFADSPPL